MIRSSLHLLVLAALLLLPVASAGCVPGTEAWHVDPYSAWAFDLAPGPWTFGEVFVANRNMNVTYLGYYDPFPPPDPSAPLQYPVALFDGSGKLLASTVVDSTEYYWSHYSDAATPWIYPGYRYGATFLFNGITAVHLVAGQTYVIEGVSSSIPSMFPLDTPMSVFLPVSVLGSNWVAGNTMNFNGTSTMLNSYGVGYAGPNFGVGPEPGSLALFGGGLLATLAMLRRRLKM